MVPNYGCTSYSSLCLSAASWTSLWLSVSLVIWRDTLGSMLPACTVKQKGQKKSEERLKKQTTAPSRGHVKQLYCWREMSQSQVKSMQLVLADDSIISAQFILAIFISLLFKSLYIQQRFLVWFDYSWTKYDISFSKSFPSDWTQYGRMVEDAWGKTAAVI